METQALQETKTSPFMLFMQNLHSPHSRATTGYRTLTAATCLIVSD